jgi:hypothetical protein
MCSFVYELGVSTSGFFVSNGTGGLRLLGTQEKIFFCKGRGTRFRPGPGFFLDLTLSK